MSEGYSQKTGSYLPDIHRVLPHSSDAEKGVLCSMLLAPGEVIDLCAEKITVDAFHVPAHATVYETLSGMRATGKLIDFITLTQTLHDSGELDRVGGAAFVGDLYCFVPTAANIAYYLEIVCEKHLARRIIEVGTNFAGRAYNEAETISALADEFEASALALRPNAGTAALRSLKDHVMEAIDDITAAHERKGISGLATGFRELDIATDGMHPSEFIIIAGKSSSGKTALALNIAESVILVAQKPVVVFSLEMTARQLANRLLLARARVCANRIRQGIILDSDFPKLTRASESLAAAQMWIDDCSTLTIQGFKQKARRYFRQYAPALMIVDYCQLMTSTTRRREENRQREITEISAGIKAAAKELSVPMILLSQFSRKPDDRAGGRPRMSDLKESSALEQDADTVLLLHRLEQHADNEETRSEVAGIADLIIAKQRNGPVCDIPLTFLKEFTRFEERARTKEI